MERLTTTSLRRLALPDLSSYQHLYHVAANGGIGTNLSKSLTHLLVLGPQWLSTDILCFSSLTHLALFNVTCAKDPYKTVRSHELDVMLAFLVRDNFKALVFPYVGIRPEDNPEYMFGQTELPLDHPKIVTVEGFYLAEGLWYSHIEGGTDLWDTCDKLLEDKARRVGV